MIDKHCFSVYHQKSSIKENNWTNARHNLSMHSNEIEADDGKITNLILSIKPERIDKPDNVTH